MFTTGTSGTHIFHPAPKQHILEWWDSAVESHGEAMGVGY